MEAALYIETVGAGDVTFTSYGIWRFYFLLHLICAVACLPVNS